MVALLVYHKNIHKIYPSSWTGQFVNSILSQTFQGFKVYEINYGGGQERLFSNSIFESKELPTFVHAMNHLIDKTLLDGADVVVNNNCDDWAAINRLEVQLPYIEQGFDIVSSNFSLIQDDRLVKVHSFDKLNIKEELNKNHNIVCHPGVMYSRHFLLNNRYEPDLIPLEDLILWQKTIDNFRFKIVPENLVYHRIHQNAVCKSQNR